jgi:hypothetical protein
MSILSHPAPGEVCAQTSLPSNLLRHLYHDAGAAKLEAPSAEIINVIASLDFIFFQCAEKCRFYLWN